MLDSGYNYTNPNDELDITTFNNRLSSLVRHPPKHNSLIIGGDMFDHIGKDENYKFRLPNLLKRNGEYLGEFSIENSFSCLKTKSNKKR